jgi:AcrR family transcriptional regulator
MQAGDDERRGRGRGRAGRGSGGSGRRGGRSGDRGGGRGGGAPIWAREPREQRGRARAVTRDEIVAAALAVADDAGFEAVSMRNVAARLGVGAMTIYHYVPSKDDLLDLMFDEVMGELLLPDPLPDGWRAAITAIAQRTREVWARHPWLSSSIGARSGFGPNAMRHVEQSLAAVADLGIEGPEAFVVLAAVDDYALGHVMRQLGAEAALGREGLDADEWRRTMEPYWREMIATGEFPRMAQIADAEWEFLNEERFELGLSWILDGIAARYER